MHVEYGVAAHPPQGEPGNGQFVRYSKTRHVILVKGHDAIVCLAEVDDCEAADGCDEHDKKAEAEQQPGSCIEILKPVHAWMLPFRLAPTRLPVWA